MDQATSKGEDIIKVRPSSTPSWMHVDMGLPLPVQELSDPNLVLLTGGRKNSWVYEGQLIARQREALAAWKETDNYKDAYLKKKKRRRRRPEWTPQSKEYQFDAIIKKIDPSLFGKLEASTGKPPNPYISFEYKAKMKEGSAIPIHEIQKSAYKSLEYQQAYPVPPISYPGVPLGNIPEEGPWVEVFDSMWNPFWVTLKGLDLGEAHKREEFIGFDLNSDKVA